MIFQLPVIINSGKTILQVLQEEDVTEDNYKKELSYDAVNIIYY